MYGWTGIDLSTTVHAHVRHCCCQPLLLPSLTCERVHAVCGGAVAAVALRDEAREAADAVAAHLWL